VNFLSISSGRGSKNFLGTLNVPLAKTGRLSFFDSIAKYQERCVFASYILILIMYDYTAKILKYDSAQKARDARRKIFQE
jgi:hypothetical protein